MDEREIAEIKAKARKISDKADEIITHRQLLAAYLMTKKNLGGQEVADIMEVETSTVYSLKTKGMKKLQQAYMMEEMIEEEPFWVLPTESEIEDEL